MTQAVTADIAAVTRNAPGAFYLGNGRCMFRVWAPFADAPCLEIVAPAPRVLELTADSGGYWSVIADGISSGTRYKYRLGAGRVFPDPASRSQPDGVHGPSEVISGEFPWTDSAWHGLSIDEYIIYELHTGTFTPEGTFDAAIGQLAYLRDLGITAIELMPVAQFPGSRNWGYDGVCLYAVQNSYGGVNGLKRLVDAAHANGLAVILDVVYNHLGPEGNYLGQFGPYFTERYRTPWGSAINFDGPDSPAVRSWFVENALYWCEEFHIDGLRLDAVHAIHDSSEPHILTGIADAVHAFGKAHSRSVTVIAESDLNEERIVRSGESGGYGLDAQWSDDFHHAIHSVLTGETAGYYEDFGDFAHIAAALSEGFVYAGAYSKHRGRCHGTDCTHVPGRAFVVCVQNHDQVGNRMMGERLSHLVSLDDLKLAAGVLLLSPFVPMLFMGQEYGETAPFMYFVSHSDAALVKAVREGRKREFASFAWRGDVPDPQAEETFAACRLNHDLRNQGHHAILLKWYRELLRLRRDTTALTHLNRAMTSVTTAGAAGQILVLRRWSHTDEIIAAFNFGRSEDIASVPATQSAWARVLDSADPEYLGTGPLLPRRIHCEEGSVHLTLKARQCAVLRCCEGHSSQGEQT